MPEGISINRALEIVRAASPLLSAEDVPLAEVLGRVLAEDVAADIDLPPFDRATMDGFAVRAADTASAPIFLLVAGSIRAGRYSDCPLRPGEALGIATGAPLPPGADAVEQVEKTRSLEAGRRVEILEPVEVGANVIARGAEATAGSVLLPKGETITPAAVAVLAAAGRARVLAARRPRVAVIVTGDELVDVGAVPAAGQIRDSNRYALLAQIAAAGGVGIDMGTVADDPGAIADRLERAFREDVVLICGGASAGESDLTAAALAAQDVAVAFTRVAVKPGAPLIFGRRGASVVFGLPGNPVSAQVAFEIFVREALRCMLGARRGRRPSVEAELRGSLENRSGRPAYLPVLLRWDGGRFVADPVASRGSGDVVAHARAQGLARLEPHQVTARSGDRVPVFLLPSFLDEDGTRP